MYPLHRQRCSCIFTLWSIYIDLWYSAWYGLVTRAFVHQYIPAIFHQSWILPETYCIRVLLLQTTFWGDVVWCQYNSPNCIGCTQRYSKRIGTNMIQNLRRKKHLFLGSCSRVRRVNLKQVVCKYMYVYTFIYIYIYIYTSITIISIHKTCKFTGFFWDFFEHPSVFSCWFQKAASEKTVPGGWPGRWLPNLRQSCGASNPWTCRCL